MTASACFQPSELSAQARRPISTLYDG